MCAACGENAHQCQKCRTINYDERDPFLCISCGFSKYARFETLVEGRPTSAVDPIETEDDRKKVRERRIIQQQNSLINCVLLYMYTVQSYLHVHVCICTCICVFTCTVYVYYAHSLLLFYSLDIVEY